MWADKLRVQPGQVVIDRRCAGRGDFLDWFGTHDRGMVFSGTGTYPFFLHHLLFLLPLLSLSFLYLPSYPPSVVPTKEEEKRKRGEKKELTLVSIQARNASSNLPHPSIPDWWPLDAQHPSTAVMTPRQGFEDSLFGRRIRSLGSGGRRIPPLILVPVIGGIVLFDDSGGGGVMVVAGGGAGYTHICLATGTTLLAVIYIGYLLYICNSSHRKKNR